MLITFDFEFDRLLSFLAAMNLIPAYRPDAQTPLQVAVRQATADGVRDAYINANQTLTLHLGAIDVAWDAVHDASVANHGAMVSMYRKDEASSRALASVPTKDQSRREIELRAKALSALWAKLPLPPGYPVPPGPGPHTVEPSPGSTLLNYLGLIGTARSLESQTPALVAEFEKQEGILHEQEGSLRDFNVNAREQGLLQFTSGWQREVIEAIPTAAPELPPSKGEIKDVDAPGGPTILVQVSAARASKFRLQGKGPGMTDFVTLVPEWPLVRIPCTLPGVGAWTLQVQGFNAKGDGEWSDDFAVTVPA